MGLRRARAAAEAEFNPCIQIDIGSRRIDRAGQKITWIAAGVTVTPTVAGALGIADDADVEGQAPFPV